MYLRFPSLPFAALLLALGLGACAAPVAWHKSGASASQAQRDLATCRQYAATHDTGRHGDGSQPIFVPGAMPRPQNNPMPYQQYWMNYSLDQQRLQDRCMRSLGYRLAPSGP